jgi:hypothetical protein
VIWKALLTGNVSTDSKQQIQPEVRAYTESSRYSYPKAKSAIREMVPKEKNQPRGGNREPKMKSTTL